MVALALVAVAGFVLVWFQPQKLFIDERVDEAIPTVEPSTTTTEPDDQDAATPSTTSTTAPAEPVEVARGDFISRDHTTTGVVRVLELPDGTSIVRVEELDTDNGPDLFVYLSTTAAEGDEATFDDEHVNLGRLAGNQGNQNYALPAGTDLGRFTSVVIWCDRFDSAFGAADLVEA